MPMCDFRLQLCNGDHIRGAPWGKYHWGAVGPGGATVWPLPSSRLRWWAGGCAGVPEGHVEAAETILLLVWT